MPNIQIHDIAEKTSQGIGIGFPRNSELKQLFDYHLRFMDQSGLLHQFYNVWIHRRQPSEDLDTEIEEAFSLGFNNLTLVFTILFTGLFTAFILSIVEYFLLSRISRGN